ncbi:PucR family transcriptional regulator [Butyrivibrio proteoclasticus]|uniref:PucR family transcriptional regulator n=1 Tax=Butyrivibrio proteoclasticus TaxID=43305 RepID=UPI00047B2A3D|nr:helix-turn-helix domain-containing protein [Butyrivibrio proteoclasticus]
MISNQILQNTIDGLKTIAHVELSVLDVDGKEVASTSNEIGDVSDSARDFVSSPADSQEIQGYQYFKIYDEQQLEYILICTGNGENTYMLGKMIAYQIQGLLVAYKERFDKDNFIKNLLLDNLLLVDIYSRAKKLHIQTDSRRIAMIIETANGRDNNALETIRSRFGNSNDFVTEVDEDNVVVVKDVSDMSRPSDITKAAEEMLIGIQKEGLTDVRIAYGTIVGEIKEVSRSYKEAKMALDVGKIFFEDRRVICYSELGIGRLIYQLPIPLCKMFIREIFGGSSPDDFDYETLTTIDKFFENSLNVSETSRQLFIHRNTLVYRLDKLQKSTGLDLRIFDDAITFKIALMVVRYMKYMEKYT